MSALFGSAKSAPSFNRTTSLNSAKGLFVISYQLNLALHGASCTHKYRWPDSKRPDSKRTKIEPKRFRSNFFGRQNQSQIPVEFFFMKSIPIIIQTGNNTKYNRTNSHKIMKSTHHVTARLIAAKATSRRMDWRNIFSEQGSRNFFMFQNVFENVVLLIS